MKEFYRWAKMYENVIKTIVNFTFVVYKLTNVI